MTSWSKKPTCELFTAGDERLECFWASSHECTAAFYKQRGRGKEVWEEWTKEEDMDDRKKETHKKAGKRVQRVIL